MRQMDTLKQVQDVWASGRNVIVFDEEDESVWQLCPRKLYVCMYACTLIATYVIWMHISEHQS